MRSTNLNTALFTLAISLVVTQPLRVAAQTAGTQAAIPTPGYATVDLARVTSESSEGKKSTDRIQQLQNQKRAELEAGNTQAQGELNALNQQLNGSQQKLEQGQNLMSSSAAVNLQNEIARIQREIQRKSQDAQASLTRLQEDADLEVQALARELQVEFEDKLAPAINQLMIDRGISLIVRAEAVVLSDPALDLTDELIELLDSQAAAAP